MKISLLKDNCTGSDKTHCAPIRNRAPKPKLLLALTLYLLTSGFPALATWSVIAVDKNTGEIGIAGASCTFDVSGIASIVPGKGAIVVQAASNYFARMKGVELMQKSQQPQAILQAMKADNFTPMRQQYGINSLYGTDGPATFSGEQIKAWKGVKSTDDVAVLGNLLYGEEVINDAYSAFNSGRDNSLSSRLMSALVAGAKAGGDMRCGEQKARSAFLMHYQPSSDAITKLSVSGIQQGGQPAVDLLAQQYVKMHGSPNIISLNGEVIKKDDLDAFLVKQMTDLNIPGLSFTYISDEAVSFERFYGVKNVETGEPVSSTTMFDAGSMSKTVFAAYVLSLVDQGVIDLDKPLYEYMPYPDIAHDPRYKEITTRMVLSHTSGFPNWRFLDRNGNYDSEAKLRIDFTPGSQYQYSGEGYQYLAKTIAHLNNISVNDLQQSINKALFSPLNMHHNSYVWNEYLQAHRADGHYRGKLNKGYGANKSNSNFNAAASLQSNAPSFSNFVIAMMKRKFLSDPSYQQMLSTQSTPFNDSAENSRTYGLGVVIEATEYGTNYSHGGDNLSSTAQFLFNDKAKSGFVFFTNSEHKNTLQQRLMTFLLKGSEPKRSDAK